MMDVGRQELICFGISMRLSMYFMIMPSILCGAKLTDTSQLWPNIFSRHGNHGL